MDLFPGLMREVLDNVEYIKFDKGRPWHRYLVCLYCSIIEYCDTLICLEREKKGVSIPSISRVILEAYVELKNICKDENYAKNMEASHLSKWLSITREAGTLNNPYLKGMTDSEGFDEQVASWQKELDGLLADGHRELNNSVR